MNLQPVIRAAVLAIVLMVRPEAGAYQKPLQPGHADFDVRRERVAAPLAAANSERGAALGRLRERLPKAQVDFDELLGAPKLIRARDGFLTGPAGQGRGLAAKSLAAFPAGDRHRVPKAFLQEHRGLFGHGPEALDRARIKHEYSTPHNGMRTVAWEQTVDGIPVYEGVLIAHLTKGEELINLSSQFVPDPEQAATAGARLRARRHLPDLSPAVAVLQAARALEAEIAPTDLAEAGPPAAGAQRRQRFRAAPFTEEPEARLVWLPLEGGKLRLCWQVELTLRSRGETFRVLVDAQSGEVLLRRCLTVYVGTATYRVFTNDSPTPFSPGHASPLTNQPPSQGRSLVTWAALDLNASPKGWLDDGVIETRGNNCIAHLDRDANNQPDLPRPQGTATRVFDFPLDLETNPTNSGAAAVVQLFYWCNWMHDRLYALGFTEAAGNFQMTNFGRGGLGNDAVIADAQDGSGFNNANFTPTPDGAPPRLQMYLFNGPTPWRDGDLDAEIILHEYTHGLTDRLVGGGAGISALQSIGMAEGWSDFYPLALLSEPHDDPDGTYPIGAYATHRYDGLTDNYYYGIRRYPYSTSLAKNPLTFKDIDPGQADPHPGVPLSPLLGPFNAASAGEVHHQGEVWCALLWEVRANLIAKHGAAVGNELALRLVTDGLKLSPPNPTFVQGRDAILQADMVNHGGANQLEIWRGFAKRGLGFSAVAPPSYTTGGVLEAFDLPNDLRITPKEGVVSNGEVGGPFTIPSATYALTNAGTNALAWTLTATAEWLQVSAAGGTLATGAPAQSVIASLTPAAEQLAAGIYTNTLLFTNLNSGLSQTRTFTLRVGQPDYFTELFSADNDLAYQSFTFTPDGSPSYYAVCRETAAAFPTDPAEGNSVTLSDDGFTQVTLAGGAEVALYGHRHGGFFIGANGYLTFGEGDIEYSESFGAHFRLRRVSALFDDLNPAAGGTVSWKQLSNRVAVTYHAVPEYGSATRLSSFQIELYFDGRLRLTYLQVGCADGLVGLSAGQGAPAGFQESEFHSYPECLRPLLISVPATAIEGQGALLGQGRVSLMAPSTNPLLVQLSSSNPKKVTVPPSVVLPTGGSNVLFDLAFPDDEELDGPQLVTITALALDYAPGQATVTVFDNEPGRLSLTLPAIVREGDGTAFGTVIVTPAPGNSISVGLTSDMPAEIQVPAEVLVPAGQTSAVFALTVLDDTVIDGAQTVTVTALVPHWTEGTATLTILDNESLTLTVQAPAAVREGEGQLAGAGRVQLAGSTLTNLTVNLVSSDPTELTLPSTATIPAGQASVFFDLIVADDDEWDGAQSVEISASAGGFESGATSLVVNDNEVPRVPGEPAPADGAVHVFPMVTLAWQGDGPPVTHELYLGTGPDLGEANFLGATPDSTWTLPPLAPATTYYWQIVARRAVATPGPVWQFTTRGVDHFEWSPMASPQSAGLPFAVTVTAKDILHATVSNFTGTVTLRGFRRSGGAAAVVLTEVQPNDPDSVELMNVSAQPVDVSGWQVVAYDPVSWPGPRSTFTIPPGTVVPAGEAFLVLENGTAPGAYPSFYTGVNFAWNPEETVFNQTAVLLRDAQGRLADFVCAAGAFPEQIVNPQVIPADQWLGEPLTVVAVGQTYQRVGERDDHSPTNWSAALPSLRAPNTGLTVPFVDGSIPVPILPESSALMVQGRWTGPLTVLESGREVVLEARDAEGRYGASEAFDVLIVPVVRLDVKGQTVSLSWDATPDAVYRVEWKSSVAGAEWSTLVEGIRATGATAYANDALANGTQRFYRVVRLP